jgi:hypothetical protein
VQHCLTWWHIRGATVRDCHLRPPWACQPNCIPAWLPAGASLVTTDTPVLGVMPMTLGGGYNDVLSSSMLCLVQCASKIWSCCSQLILHHASGETYDVLVLAYLPWPPFWCPQPPEQLPPWGVFLMKPEMLRSLPLAKGTIEAERKLVVAEKSDLY